MRLPERMNIGSLFQWMRLNLSLKLAPFNGGITRIKHPFYRHGTENYILHGKVKQKSVHPKKHGGSRSLRTIEFHYHNRDPKYGIYFERGRCDTKATILYQLHIAFRREMMSRSWKPMTPSMIVHRIAFAEVLRSVGFMFRDNERNVLEISQACMIRKESLTLEVALARKRGMPSESLNGRDLDRVPKQL